MSKAKHCTVYCETRPGALAQVARVLGDAKVNIPAFAIPRSGTDGFVQIVVDGLASIAS